MQKISLNKQVSIPILGFGTWQLPNEKARQPVEMALEAGFRHIDTAAVYDNHQVIGEVLKHSGLKREELFITSKVWREDLRQRSLIEAAQAALETLQTPYLDLYLIHWPNKEIPIAETLETMQNLKEKGLIKAIGVSNFTVHHLEKALEVGVEITNNQVELHPSFNQRNLKNWCQEHNIQVTAYSPIGQGKDLKLPTIVALAKKYGASESQVILAWMRQNNIIAIPRSSDLEHIKENFESQKLELKPEDQELMDQIPQQERMLNPPFAEFED